MMILIFCSYLFILTRFTNGYALLDPQIIVDTVDQFGLKNLFRPIEQQQINKNLNHNSNYNNLNTNNYKSNYKSNYNSNQNSVYNSNQNSIYNNPSSNYVYKTNYNYNYNKLSRRTKITPNYRYKPDYFSYQTIEQKPIKGNEVQIKFEDQLNTKIPSFVGKTMDKQMKKIKDKQQRINDKKMQLIRFRKYDEINKLEKLEYRLQAIKIRVQEQIEELKNLEYRCRRKRLIFFDTMWKNTATILKNLESDIDNQLDRVSSLLKDFTAIFDQLEKAKEKQQALNLDYSDGSVKSNEVTESFYSNMIGSPSISKERIDEKLKEPRLSLDQLEVHSNKLISTNKVRLEKIKIVVDDFKKEFKDKL